MRSRRERTSPEVRIPIKPVLEALEAEINGERLYGDWVPDLERWVAIKCPFHDDKNASASVNTAEDVQLFVCHSCDLKGNAYQIIMKVRGLGFQDAVEVAAGYAGTGTEGVLGKPRRGSAVPGEEGDYPRARTPRRAGRRRRFDPGA